MLASVNMQKLKDSFVISKEKLVIGDNQLISGTFQREIVFQPCIYTEAEADPLLFLKEPPVRMKMKIK